MQKCCEQAHAPVRIDDRVRTVFITCDELEQLPEWTVRRHFGPFTVLRTPGASLPENNEQELLQALVSKSSVKHLVICQHSLCSKFLQATQFRRSLHKELNIDYRRSLWQQQLMRISLPKIKQWLKSINRDDIEVHGWIYEPETDWISALDSDCETFVPLTAHVDFYKDNLLAH